MLEKDIEKSVKRYAGIEGLADPEVDITRAYVVPDQIFITPYGHVIFIEFKREGAKPTPGQLREHEKLRNQGCIVYVIDSVNEGKVMIDAHTGSV